LPREEISRLKIFPQITLMKDTPKDSASNGFCPVGMDAHQALFEKVEAIFLLLKGWHRGKDSRPLFFGTRDGSFFMFKKDNLPNVIGGIGLMTVLKYLLSSD